MSTWQQRQEQYAAETERHRGWYLERLQEAFDHRHDGVAADTRFKNELGIYAVLFENGSKCRALAPLMLAEKRLQRARGGM